MVAERVMIKAVFKDTMETLFKDQMKTFMIRPSPSGRRRVVRITRSGAELVEVLPMTKSQQDQADREGTIPLA